MSTPATWPSSSPKSSGVQGLQRPRRSPGDDPAHLGRLLTEATAAAVGALIAASADEAGLPKTLSSARRSWRISNGVRGSPCSTRSRASTWILSDPCQAWGWGVPGGPFGRISEARRPGWRLASGRVPFDAPSARRCLCAEDCCCRGFQGIWPDRSRQEQRVRPVTSPSNNLSAHNPRRSPNGCRPCSRDKMSPEIRSDRSGDVEFSRPVRQEGEPRRSSALPGRVVRTGQRRRPSTPTSSSSAAGI